MHITVLCEDSEVLPQEPEYDTRETEQCGQSHIRHDRLHVATFNGPGRDELGKAVPPQIFVDGDADEDGAGDWLV